MKPLADPADLKTRPKASSPAAIVELLTTADILSAVAIAGHNVTWGLVSDTGENVRGLRYPLTSHRRAPLIGETG